ncbi:hypothetical protein B9Z55_027636 [Caenorhabditis nigoni]|uniref:Uncharacterized protein n=2 Tax=Caenorhabditis nigoni TaxID=1611254 RepID=A0A2G5SF29_9PELO|nr:hypothetical protein B9Z55_027636 [Caenorhabditis nigoni]
MSSTKIFSFSIFSEFQPLLQYVGPHCFHYCHRNSICIARSDDPKNVGLVLYNVYRNIVFHLLTFLSTPFAIKKIRSTAYFQKSTVFLIISNMCFGMFHNLIYLVIQMGATALKILYKQRVKKGTYVLEIDGTRFRKFCNAQYSPFDCWEVREKKEAFHVVLDKTKLVLYANGRKDKDEGQVTITFQIQMANGTALSFKADAGLGEQR